MWSLLRNVRHLPRYRRLVATLSRHGLGWLVDRAGLSRFISWPRRILRREAPPQALPNLAQRLCRALEDLGPTFILLGRYLSTRVDLLPPELCRELAGLPAGPPPMPSSEAQALLEQELERPFAECWSDFSPQPWRCTWVEQVHQARTPSGQMVLVALPQRTLADFERERPFLQELARWVDARHLPGPWSATELLQSFESNLRQYADARERGRNAERWRRSAQRPAQLVVPTVDWERSSARVLTVQCPPGRPLEAWVEEFPAEAASCVRTTYDFFAAMMIEHGFYPAPPELGGVVILEDGRMALTSFAPSGYLGPSTQQGLLHLLECFEKERAELAVPAAISLGLLQRRHDPAATQRAIRHLSERYHGLPLAELHMAELASDLFRLAQRGTLQFPPELNLLLRSMVQLEQYGRRLAPEMPLLQALAPVVQRGWQAQHSWSARQERLRHTGQAWLEGLVSLPLTMHDLLLRTQEGDLLVGIEPRGWQQPMRRLRRMVYRLILSVITAGLVIALTLLITALPPDFWTLWGWIPSVLGALTLAGLGFLLFLSFLRRDEGR
ncbi:MAG: hypothetical protein JXA37_02610 [Chloroflexia bacterium]|nr:hypothetical protein [Chloroflexia bacterium]